MKDLQVGDEGELWMKGPIIMKGVSPALVIRPRTVMMLKIT